MYNLVTANKRKTYALITVFSLVIIGLGWLLSETTPYGYGIFVVALAFNLVSVFTSFYGGDKLVLASMRASQIEKPDDPELFRIVENLALQKGIPMPKVFVIPESGLNAFATGRDPEHASVAITIGLRQRLTKPELEAVMAHEISHIVNYDIRIALVTSILLGLIVFMADMLLRTGLGRNRRSENNSSQGIFIIIAIISALLAPVIGQLIKLAISRKREYLADASAVLTTRYPDALVSALEKIAHNPTVRSTSGATSHMFIFPPLKSSFFSRLFSTHPPIQERINAIRTSSGIR